MINNNKPLCDSCGAESNNDQEYVGYGMMFCQKCIAKLLIRIPNGFRFKTLSEKYRKDSNERNLRT